MAAKIKPIEVAASIDRREYLQIPEFNTLISKFEPDKFKGFDWNETHFKVVEGKLFMAPLHLFMPNFVNVVKAHQEKSILYDGLGKPLSKDETEDIYKHLTSDHINGGAFSALDAQFRFDEKNNLWYVETDHRVIEDGTDKLVSFRRTSLEKHLDEDCRVSLKFNSQGLPTEKSEDQNYSPGKNLYFYKCKNGAVAWFDADSVGAVLYCFGNPSDADPALGVFVCAEGA